MLIDQADFPLKLFNQLQILALDLQNSFLPAPSMPNGKRVSIIPSRTAELLEEVAILI